MFDESTGIEQFKINSTELNRKIAYSRKGELNAKHIFLCLPGLLETRQSFHLLISLASSFEDCCWLSIDYCGRGDSDPLANYQNYSFTKYLSDIEILMNGLILPSCTFVDQKFHLIGTSMGGILAMHLINLYKGKFNTLILNDIGLFLHWSHINSLYRSIKESKIEFQNLRVDPRAIKAIYNRAHFDLSYEIDFQGLIFYPLLKQFHGVVILLHNNSSPICPLTVARQSKNMIANLKLWTVDNHVHPVHWDEHLIDKLVQILKIQPKVIDSCSDMKTTSSVEIESQPNSLDFDVIDSFLKTSQIYFENNFHDESNWLDNLLNRIKNWKKRFGF